jgi:restriction system protein
MLYKKTHQPNSDYVRQMARRNESIFNLLIELPWWVSVVFAGFVYFIVGIFLPSMESSSPVVAGISKGISAKALWIALFFLLPAPLSLLKRKKVTKRGQRRGSALDILFEAPWWSTLGLAIFTFSYFIVFQPEPMKTIGYSLTTIFLLASAVSAIQAARKRTLLENQRGIGSLKELDWKPFEELVGEAYRRLGYQVTENANAGADGGVDIRLEKEGRVSLVQCKQWRNQSVGVKTVREMFGILIDEQADEVIIVCTGSYTQDAMNFSAGKPIQLITGDKLQSLVSSVQSTNNAQPTISIPKPQHEARVCPRCGSKLILRTAKRGTNAGSQFYGCGSFPKCRYTES